MDNQGFDQLSQKDPAFGTPFGSSHEVGVMWDLLLNTQIAALFAFGRITCQTSANQLPQCHLTICKSSIR